MARKRKKPKMEYRYYQMPGDSPILALLGEKWRQNYGRDVDYLHFHNYLEIGFCYEGEGTMTYGEEILPFHGREFTVIPRNFPHTTDSAPGNISYWEYLFIDVEKFLPQMTGNAVRAERMLERINSRALFMKEEECPTMAVKILAIMEIMRHSREFYMEEAKGALAALLAEIARYNVTPEETLTDSAEARTTSILSIVLDYISEHYMDEIRIEELAVKCHLSETHFRRLFSEYMHMSPLEYINMVRIHAACEYLKKTDKPVAEIALVCGFNTNSTFNRNFKQVMGTSPMEWRKRPENYEQQLLKFNIRSEEGW